VAAAELPFEFMLNALRLVEGFPISLFEERTGLSVTAIQRQLEKAESAGLLERDWKRIRPTERGQRFLNELLASFLGGETPGRAPGVPIAVRAIRTS
jgi:coproporphyrinogen III oxidase-like Fe-S oxidoreductase